MFGFKIVKSQDYRDLNWRLEQALVLIDEKDTRIAELSEVIRKKEAELKKKAVLLTDVAETPLVEEPKSERKPKRVIKKTDEAKNHKKVTRKTDEQ